MPLAPGSKAPDFALETDTAPVSLAALKGKTVVLYFYPKDDTPGCTKESCTFRDNLPDFSKIDADIIGISKDSVASHDAFKEKFQLPFKLASDEGGDTCERYGVWVEKNRDGRTYMGIDRATFLIDKQGVLRKEWRGVQVPGHVEEVLQAAQSL